MKIKETDHDPQDVLKEENDKAKHAHHEKLFHKTPHGRRILILSVLMAVFVGGSLFAAVGSRQLLRTAECVASRGKPCEQDKPPVDPVDPRCEMHPEHANCDPVDPDNPPEEPPENPLPPTPGGDADNMLSGSVNMPAGFTVPAGEVWIFDPAKDTTVEVESNVVVLGVLEMKPNAGVKHTLRFKGVNEALFTGGGLELIDDDIGLWVIDDGILDIEGEKKTGWNRTGTDSTWKSSDELKVAPTAIGDYTANNFTLGSNVPQLDSSVPKGEVFNLTRSVNIEGTTSGYSHVIFLSSQPQSIKYAALRYMGISSTLGRYPLHFHFMGDASRGSLVEGVVVRDSKEHAFVAHASHGVTFKDTVAYNIQDDAYWWDPIKGTGSNANATNDITYDHALAVDLQKDLAAPHSLCAFNLLAGSGGVAKDSAAAGVNGQTNAAGFCWSPNDLQVWEFSGNVAHNNPKNGIWVWHNDATSHLITDFVAYANDGAGIDHGAYANNYSYADIYLYKNATGIELHAANNGSATWKCVKERASTSGVALNILNTNAATIKPFTFVSADFEGKTLNNSNGDLLTQRATFTSGSCPAN